MSSGQPYKKPSDVQMYKNEYLLDLEMRKDLDKINYDANMNYIKTGALPPQSQMSDSRTVNDKLLDLVYIKKHIITTLSPLSNNRYAENIVEAILSNPNNVDNKLLIFTAQRAPEIAEQLKKIYSIGIKGDLDDSMKLVAYIIKLFRVQHNSMLSLREVQNRFTSDKTSQTSLLGTLHNIILQIISYMEYMLRDKNDNIAFMNELRNLKRLLSFIPDNKGNINININNEIIRSNIENMEKYITSDNNGLIEMASKYMAFLNSDFPNVDDLNYLFKEIIKAFETWQRNKNIENKEKLYTRLMNIYNILYNDDIILRLDEFVNIVSPPIARLLASDQGSLEVGQEDEVPSINPSYEGDPFSTSSDTTATNQNVPDLIPSHPPPSSDNTSGNGLTKRGRGRPRGSGVAKPYKQTIKENLNTDKGLEESRRFVKFGRYLINMNKLNDNILSLKVPSGGTVIGHPVTKITSAFSKIVKNMVNNINPSFNDLKSLSDTEKNYLYTISKKANILDKFSIPTPDMSEDDKDINEYEILKGEILAGNDNKDLIRKFKAKIVKMSNNGLLNKKDVSSILHDLLNLNL